jgi:hypothetical protein
MRGWLLLCALLPAACGNTTGADVLRVMVWPIPVPASWGAAPEGRDGEWDQAQATAAPAAEVALSLSLGSRRGVARLVQEEGERRMWRTSGGVVVATDGPRVVATAGLRDILAATRFEGGADPLSRLAELGEEEVRSARVVDVMRSGNDPERMRFGMRLDCRVQAWGTEQPDTVLVEERCRGAARFTNRFWADARSHAVFRSEQWVGEGMPLLVVEVVGPPPADIVTLPR